MPLKYIFSEKKTYATIAHSWEHQKVHFGFAACDHTVRPRVSEAVQESA